MEKTKIELINFMMWFQSDTAHLNYDPVTAVNEYYKFINSASNESLSVRDNEGKKKKCIHYRYCYYAIDSICVEDCDRDCYE
jgi:hypothetical protein